MVKRLLVLLGTAWLAGCTGDGLSRGAWPDLDLRTGLERQEGDDQATRLRAGIRIGMEAGLQRADLARANLAIHRQIDNETVAQTQRTTALARQQAVQAAIADRLKTVAQAQMNVAQERLRRCQTGQAQGHNTRLELLAAQAAVLRASLDLAQADRASLAAGPATAPPEPEQAPDWLEQDPLVLATDAVQRSGELAALSSRVDVEQFRATAQRQRGLVPNSIDLGLEREDGPTRQTQWTWNFGMVFRLPVPDADLIRRNIEVQLARSRQRIAQTQLHSDLALAVRQAQAAWQTRQHWRQNTEQDLIDLETDIAALSTTDHDQADARIELLTRLADLHQRRAELLNAWSLARVRVETLLALP